jgi:hypothetical protein
MTDDIEDDMNVDHVEDSRDEVDQKLADLVAGMDLSKLPAGTRAKVRAARRHGTTGIHLSVLEDYRLEIEEGADDDDV